MIKKKIMRLKFLLQFMTESLNHKYNLIEKMDTVPPEEYEDFLHDILGITFDVCADNARLYLEAKNQLKELRRNRPPTILDRIINMAKKWNMWRDTNGK